MEAAFTVLSAERIEGCFALWNTGSVQVLTHIGMKFVCHIVQEFQKHGKWVEEKLLAIEREDWKTARF